MEVVGAYVCFRFDTDH